MKKNIKCIIAYKGTHYFGWQKTKMGPSIEEALEKTLSQILQHPIQLQAASRTDRGVHAEGQVVNFWIDKPGYNLEKLHRSLRGLLPPDISPLSLEWVKEDFHPTLDTRGKEYQYSICHCPIQLPFHREFSWHYPLSLAIPLMEKGGKILEGTHDYSAFTNLRYQNAVRTIHQIDLVPLSNERLCIQIKGESFLYKMVRNIVGTLVYVGSGKIPLETLPQILASKDRTLSGMTAPAHGLSLKKVFY